MAKYGTAAVTVSETTEISLCVAQLTLALNVSAADAEVTVGQIYDAVAAIPYSGGALLRVVAIANLALIHHPDWSVTNAVSWASNVYWTTHEYVPA